MERDGEDGFKAMGDGIFADVSLEMTRRSAQIDSVLVDVDRLSSSLLETTTRRSGGDGRGLSTQEARARPTARKSYSQQFRGKSTLSAENTANGHMAGFYKAYMRNYRALY